jgi:hypothetical protein
MYTICSKAQAPPQPEGEFSRAPDFKCDKELSTKVKPISIRRAGIEFFA